jgi:hypothetical protein
MPGRVKEFWDFGKQKPPKDSPEYLIRGSKVTKRCKSSIFFDFFKDFA